MNNEEFDIEKLTEEQLDAYMTAMDAEVPDLWDRIEQGYEQEVNQNTSSNVVSFDAVRRKKKIYRRYIVAAAAMLLVVLIAVPIMNRDTTDKKSDKAGMDMSMDATGSSNGFTYESDSLDSTIKEDESVVEEMQATNEVSNNGDQVMPDNETAVDCQSVITDAYVNLAETENERKLAPDECMLLGEISQAITEYDIMEILEKDIKPKARYSFETADGASHILMVYADYVILDEVAYAVPDYFINDLLNIAK